MDLKELANELDELREMEDSDPNLDAERLEQLVKLEDELGDLHLASRDKHLIAESDFESYCQDLAEDFGWVSKSNPLSNYIDWAAYARDCESDYSTVDFDGDTYYYHD